VDTTIKVCVIIPAKGSVPKIEKGLRSILDSGYPNLEVIVVDDGIDKAGLEIVDKFFDRIKILKSGSKGPSFARNLAARETDAELIAFTDSDCIVGENWIKELIRGMDYITKAISCGGSQEAPFDATPFEKGLTDFLKRIGFVTDYMRGSKRDKIVTADHNPSCNVLYRRDIFLKEGGFLEGLWPGEDLEFDYRLRKKGYRVAFNPKAVVYHYRPDTINKFADMMFRYGKVQAFLVKKYGPFRKIHAVFPVSVLLMAGFVYAGLTRPMLTTAIIAISVALATFPFIKLFFVTVFCWNWGFLKGLFLRQRKKKEVS